MTQLERAHSEIHRLKECLADLCDLRETISEDVDLIEIGRHPDTGQWRVWHQEYPLEGSFDLVASPGKAEGA